MSFQLISAVSALLLIGCAPKMSQSLPVLPTSQEGVLVEKAILWDDKLDKTWAPQGMKQLLQDKESFAYEGTRFLVLTPLVVFGHRAAYLSMKGYDGVMGPNAVLKGTPKSIAASISATYGLIFNSRKGVYLSDYKPNVRVLIEKHPSLEGASIVIGAYTGE